MYFLQFWIFTFLIDVILLAINAKHFNDDNLIKGFIYVSFIPGVNVLLFILLIIQSIYAYIIKRGS